MRNWLCIRPSSRSALVADAILDCSQPGGIVLDAFAGSGSTLIRRGKRPAAEVTGIEIDPHYVDTIIRRFREGVTGSRPGTWQRAEL